MAEDQTSTQGDAPDDLRLAFDVFNEIGIIAQLSRTMLERRLPDGLIAPHFAVLNHLVRLGDGWPPLRIARAFQVPKTSMTHTLAGLEGRGLIEMRPNPEDGRSKLVFITQAGRAVREAAVAATSQDISTLTSSFGINRLPALLPELRALRQLLDENRFDP